jgi:hypothetical protein
MKFCFFYLLSYAEKQREGKQHKNGSEREWKSFVLLFCDRSLVWGWEKMWQLKVEMRIFFGTRFFDVGHF